MFASAGENDGKGTKSSSRLLTLSADGTSKDHSCRTSPEGAATSFSRAPFYRSSRRLNREVQTIRGRINGQLREVITLVSGIKVSQARTRCFDGTSTRTPERNVSNRRGISVFLFPASLRSRKIESDRDSTENRANSILERIRRTRGKRKDRNRWRVSLCRRHWNDLSKNHARGC